MYERAKYIVLEFVPVKEQPGYCDHDYGIFAVTFAISLCTGHNPAESTYVQHLL